MEELKDGMEKDLKKIFPKGHDYPQNGQVHFTRIDGTVVTMVGGEFVEGYREEEVAEQIQQPGIMVRGLAAIKASIARVIARYDKWGNSDKPTRSWDSDGADRMAERHWATRLRPRRR